mgnify:CR=1 FL=1
MQDIKALPEMDEIDEQEFLDAQAAQEELMKAQIQTIAGTLETLALEIEGKRRVVEDRWYQDIRQKYGRYDDKTEASLTASKKSQLFVKITRPKCNIWASKMTDILFPTDDKNWSMGATPIPELSKAVDDAPNKVELETAQQGFDEQSKEYEAGNGEMPDAMPVDDMEAKTEVANASKEYTAMAEKASKAMELECEDQLVEARFGIEARKVINDSVDCGTGIIKGPFASGNPKKVWVEKNGNWLKINQDAGMPKPDFKRVDYWSFFPDPNATTIEEAEFTFERHVLTAKDLRKWAKGSGFDKEAIRRVLEEGSKGAVPDYLTQVRSITLQETSSLEDKYIVWEYRGPLQKEDMEALYAISGNQEGLDYVREFDALEEMNVVVYLCNKEVFKFGIDPMDSGDCCYSVYNLVSDPSSIWGFGVPFLMRDSQSSVNSAWRMMMDNGALSTGPQIVVNKKAIQPANGSYELTPRKVWHMTQDIQKTSQPPFQTYHIDGRQEELSNIVAMAKEFADEEINLPAIVQGEESSGAKNTYAGMALLTNSANVVFRNAVRNYDDMITTPTLTRLYDWNMQFNPKKEIKGDTRVDARGSSVLLVREMQSQNMMIMLEKFSEHPTLGPIMKIPETFRKVIQGLMLSADDVVKDDETIAIEAKELAEQIAAEQAAEQEANNTGQDPNYAIDMKMEMAKMDMDTRKYVADKEHDTYMIRLASERDMKIEELAAKLSDKRQDRESRERTFTAEAGVKMSLADKALAAKNADKMPTGTKFEG